LWNTTETTQAITTTGAGTYSVTVTNLEGCSASSSVLITINTNPVVALGADVIQCGGNVTLDAGNTGSSYQWNDLSTNQTLTATSPANGTYFVTVTDGNGCSGSDTINIIIYPNPTVSIAQPAAICAPNTISIDAGPGFVTYTWSNGSTNQVLTTATSGNYFVTISDGNNCSAISNTVAAAINPLPIVTLNPATNITCASENPVALNANPPGGTYTGIGAFNDLFFASLVGINGNYQIGYSYTDNNGCTSNASTSIQITSGPVVTLGAFDDVCQNDTPISLSTGQPIGGSYFIDGNLAVGSLLDPSIIGTGIHTITYVFNDGNCTGSASEFITVRPSSTITFTNNNPVYCQSGFPVQLAEGLPSGGTYSLAGNNLNGIFYPTSAGTFPIIYNYVNQFGCASQGTYNITVNGGIPLSINNAVSAICLDAAPITITASPIGGIFTLDGQLFDGQFNPQTAGIGNHIVSYAIVDNATGCVSDTTFTIVVNNVPSATLSNFGNICFGTPAFDLNQGIPFGGIYKVNGIVETQYNSTVQGIGIDTVSYLYTDGFGCSIQISTLVNNYQLIVTGVSDATVNCAVPVQLQANTNYLGALPLTYTWTPASSLNNATISNPVAVVGTNTSFEVTVSDGLCSATNTTNVNISGVDFNLAFTQNQQVFNQAPFAVLFTNLTPNQSNYTFTWDFGDGSGLFTQTEGVPVSHFYNNNGIFSIKLFAINNQTGCVDSLIRNNWIYCSGQPLCSHVATISQTGPISLCQGSGTTINCNPVDNSFYQWNINGLPITGANATSFTPELSGNYTVTIFVGGCPKTSPPIFVFVSSAPPAPVITSAGSLNFCGQGSVILQSSGGYSSYLWSTNETTQNITVSEGGNYSVTATNSSGCSANSEVFSLSNSLLTAPYICSVTVDSILPNNIVAWEKPITTTIDSFYVWRETNIGGIYEKIRSLDYLDLSEILDSTSTPSQQPYRYKLSLKDSCGNITGLGENHRTIHLTVNAGLANANQLIWNAYEGYPVGTYNIYRGAHEDSLILINSVPAQIGVNTYTDFPAPIDSLFYQIVFEFPEGYNCNSTAGRGILAQRRKSTSNVGTNFQINGPGSGINENELFEVSIYPNPNDGNFSIQLESLLLQKYVGIKIFDALGKLIKEKELGGFSGTRTVNVNLEAEAKGVYFIQIITQNQNYNKRIVIK
jgi:hypothetical protein